jgi:hypothetical protein
MDANLELPIELDPETALFRSWLGGDLCMLGGLFAAPAAS